MLIMVLVEQLGLVQIVKRKYFERLVLQGIVFLFLVFLLHDYSRKSAIDVKSMMLIQIERQLHHHHVVQQQQQQRRLLLVHPMNLVHYRLVGNCREQKMNEYFLLIILINEQHG